jgi:coenzyme F420 biosynthesis associated uncharacterized protein
MTSETTVSDAAGGPAAGMIDWRVARQVAERVARRQPAMSAGRLAVLESDFEELTSEAESLVTEATGLVSLAGPARARVTDRPGWVEANVASFERLLRPVSARLEELLMRPPPHLGPVQLRLPPSASRRLAGAQLGLLLGWMSTRVLGQYDQLLIEDEHPEDQDIVYYVGPNIVALEDRFGFPPRQFRLWLALHEVTHRSQFTGVPWMRQHFLSLVESIIGGIDPDPRHLLEALKRSVGEIAAGKNPLAEGGLVALVASPEQRRTMAAVGGLMSLLEGHGDVTMNRAAPDRLPDAPRFDQTLHERRKQRGVSKVFTTLVGLDAKLAQYQQGERFIEAVEAAGGKDLFDRVWAGPEWLPTMDEIRRPSEWIDRVR